MIVGLDSKHPKSHPLVMIFADKHPKTISHLLTVSKYLRFLNVKALVGAFNKEKALVRAF